MKYLARHFSSYTGFETAIFMWNVCQAPNKASFTYIGIGLDRRSMKLVFWKLFLFSHLNISSKTLLKKDKTSKFKLFTPSFIIPFSSKIEWGGGESFFSLILH